MAGTPPDLSTFKPVAGQPLAAAQIANGFTAVESWATNAIDPAALKQNAATIGQGLGWDGSKWAPGGFLPVAPAMLGPVGGMATNTVSVANTAHLQPLPGVVVPTTITRICLYIASGAGTGHIDVGIYYSDDEATFTRLVSKGSTVTPATGTTSLTVGSTVVTPVAGRRWYLAFACDNATPAFLIGSGSTFGALSKATSFPLPATLTGMSSSGLFPIYMHALI